MLPAVLELDAAPQLKLDLVAAKEAGPVIVNGSAVQRLSSLCLQLLLAAGATVEDASPLMREMASTLSLDGLLGVKESENG
jgi:anti-anti-sigma regulatory factor